MAAKDGSSQRNITLSFSDMPPDLAFVLARGIHVLAAEELVGGEPVHGVRRAWRLL